MHEINTFKLFQTTLARIIANKSKGKSKFVQLSATSSGVNDVKEVVKQAKNNVKMFKMRTILFLDEVHRFNKTQQVLCRYIVFVLCLYSIQGPILLSW